MPEIIRRLPAILRGWITPNLQAFVASREPQLWLISILIGLCVSIAAIMFRELILLVQYTWLGVATETVATAARQVHWLVILLVPAVGGLFVGWLLNTFIPARRTGGVADVGDAAIGDPLAGIGRSSVDAKSL